MSQPTPYDRSQLNGETYFTDWTTAHPTTPQQGNKIDQELNAIALTLAEVLANLELIQRDDGEIANDSIGLDQLKDEVETGIGTPAAWVTGTDYVRLNSVIVNAIWYWATTSHTAAALFATDLSAGYWETIFNFVSVVETTILADATTPPAALGGSSTVGSSTKAARSDHVHQVAETDELYLRNGAEYFA